MKSMLASLVIASLLLATGYSEQGSTAGQTAKVGPAELDKLLAPIALYPDALLAQMLMCANSPYQVKELNEWLKKNSTLKGSEVQTAAEKEGFDASYIALSTFPQVVQMMAEKPDWIRELGQAFKNDQEAVFASVQRLRKQAKDLGNLKTTPQQEVKTETTKGGEQVIVVQPTNPQVIYVPQYNPQVVYVQAPPPTTTVVVQQSSGPPPGTGLVMFTAGVIIGAAASNSYYWGPYGWHGGYMYHDAWNDYYDHRERMAEDYYEHRENMSQDRTERQGQRQESQGERQTGRQENQSTRQTERNETQATRQSGRNENQSGRQESRQASGTQGTQQSGRTSGQTSGQTSRKNSPSSVESRGHSGGSGSTATKQSGGSSGAFSGYGGGKSEKAASSRGKSSSGGGRRRSR